LPIFANIDMLRAMTTMNISLPDTLKAYVDEQVSARGYGTSSEYVRELIRKDQSIQRLREMLLDGAGSAATAPVDAGYFEGLRDRVIQPKAS
jgi:antitoxin ParD1/3/4